MRFRTDTFDLWIFHRGDSEPRYLLFHASAFWQTAPGGMVREGETLEAAIARVLSSLGLAPAGAWAAEHSYTIWNRKRAGLELVPVFAAEVAGPVDVPLPEGIAEAAWLTAAECEERLFFRGLLEGLRSVRAYVSEVPSPVESLRIL